MKEKRTLLLSSTKKSKTDMQIFRSLPFTTSLFIKPYTKNIILNYQKLLVSNNSNLFIHKLDDKFIVGRSYNNEIIDFLQFEVLDWFADVKKYETGSKHILVTNFDNERMRNLFVDLFGFKGDKICIEAIKYVFETKCSGNLNDINFGKKEETEEDTEECNDEIRDVKEKDITLNLNMHGLSDSESLFSCKLRIEKYWFCDMKIFKNAIKVETDKKEKNVFTNEMGDVMGKIHMEKQELREIVIKKPRKVKNKE